MLVLSRKVGEEILIGDNIRIRVLKVDRGRISVGLEADHDVPIRRAELLIPAHCRQAQPA